MTVRYVKESFSFHLQTKAKKKVCGATSVWRGELRSSHVSLRALVEMALELGLPLDQVKIALLDDGKIYVEIPREER